MDQNEDFLHEINEAFRIKLNEKLNAVAPKITDKGASAIQQQVNQAVVETASKAVFEVEIINL